MKEQQDIIRAYELAVQQGRQMALATVVAVEGSSYRRAGARMLVTDDGTMTGAISGGCLEGDALKRAQMAISGDKNKLVTYDTTDEDDARIGIQLGCNGIVHILFEPVHPDDPENPVQLLKRLSGLRCDHVLVTLYNRLNRHAEHPGTCLLLHAKGVAGTTIGDHSYYKQVFSDAVMVLKEKTSASVHYDALGGFIEWIPPRLSLVIAGAGNDAMPLVRLAHQLGWLVTVVDGRPAYLTAARFPEADHLVLSRAADAGKQIPHDDRTVYVLMTHNYQYDYHLLRHLISLDCIYIGSLGPRKKLERMLDELTGEHIRFSEMSLQHLHGPVGLDIGAETAEEIAVAVIAEIKAVIGGKKAGFLKDRQVPIHSPERELVHYPHRINNNDVTPHT